MIIWSTEIIAFHWFICCMIEAFTLYNYFLSISYESRCRLPFTPRLIDTTQAKQRHLDSQSDICTKRGWLSALRVLILASWKQCVTKMTPPVKKFLGFLHRMCWWAVGVWMFSIHSGFIFSAITSGMGRFCSTWAHQRKLTCRTLLSNNKWEGPPPPISYTTGILLARLW